MQVFASTIARARPALLAAAAARVSTGAVRRSMLANSIGARRGVHIQNKVGSVSGVHTPCQQQSLCALTSIVDLPQNMPFGACAPPLLQLGPSPADAASLLGIDYTRNKTSFTIKYFTLLSLAFALPFAATEFMMCVYCSGSLGSSAGGE